MDDSQRATLLFAQELAVTLAKVTVASGMVDDGKGSLPDALDKSLAGRASDLVPYFKQHADALRIAIARQTSGS
jgi:hypothetical protein